MLLENRTHKLRVGFNHFGDTLASESFLEETLFDVVQNFGMSRVRLIEDVFESEIRGAKVVYRDVAQRPSQRLASPSTRGDKRR